MKLPKGILVVTARCDVRNVDAQPHPAPLIQTSRKAASQTLSVDSFLASHPHDMPPGSVKSVLYTCAHIHTVCTHVLFQWVDQVNNTRTEGVCLFLLPIM